MVSRQPIQAQDLTGLHASLQSIDTFIASFDIIDFNDFISKQGFEESQLQRAR